MNILEELRGAGTIGIGGHIRPDGDCAGACLGLGLYLRKALPDARVDVFLGDLGESLSRNLAGRELIVPDYETEVSAYDAFFCLDCEPARLGDALPLYRGAGRRFNIDHHMTNPGDGDFVLVDPKASSACELVYTLLEEERMDEEIARNLYIGMVTDTGVFAFSNTSPRTMEIAGKLMGYGFDFPKVVREVFYERTYLQQQIMARAVLESVRFMDGRCVFSVLDRKMIKFYQAAPTDMEGIANQILKTTGVECSIFLHETLPHTYRISMRSEGGVNVAEICGHFGGGGHERAAGCTVEASNYRDVINQISQLIAQQWKDESVRA